MGDSELQFVAKMVNQVKGTASDVANDVRGLADNVSGGWDRSVAASQKFAAGVAIAGAAAVGAGVAMVGAFMESEAASTQLDAVLKSTGGAAGVTRDAAMGLASSLQSVTTFSDEAVLSAENILLTFTQIGKDVFPQATELSLDMAQALGMDASQAAMQLGKALNDPAEGMSKLQRIGVTFNEEQERQIKTMTAAGDVAGAQKIILAELAKEFGGSARAAATTFGGQLKQLWNIINDGMEVIGGFIAGAIRPFVQGILDFIANAGGVEGVLKGMGAAFQGVVPILPILAGAIIGGLVPAMIAFGASTWTAMAPLLPFLAAGAAIAALIMVIVNALGGWGAVANAIKPALEGVFNFIKQGLQAMAPLFTAIGNLFKAVGGFLAEAFRVAAPIIMQIASVVGPILIAVWGVVVQVFSNLVNALAGVFNALKPFMPVILAIGAAVLLYFVAPWIIAIAIITAVVIVVVQVVTWIIQGITALINFIMPALTFLWNLFSTIFNAILAVVLFVWNLIVLYITTYINIVVTVITTVLNVLQAIWNAIWNAIVAVAMFVWNAVVSVVTTYINIVRAVIQAGINAVLAIWNGITRIVGVVAGAIGSVVSTIANGISSAYNAVAGWIGRFVSVGGDIINGIVNGLRDAAGAVKDFIIGIAKDALGAVKKFLGIGSPSRMFADQIGFPMAQGIAVGIAQGAGLIQDALTSVLPDPNVALGAAVNVSADEAFGSTVRRESGSVGVAEPAPAGPTTNFYGNVTLQDEKATDRFFDRLNANQAAAAKGAPST